MVNSSFQFTKPSLESITFCINDDFDSDSEVKIETNMQVAVDRCSDKNEATVSLNFELGKRGDAMPYYVKAVEKAKFRWTEETNPEMIDGFLQMNAPALLLSYLRPIVSMTTAASKYGAFDIPFVNFTKKD